MGINTIDVGMLKNALLAGAESLEAKKDWINGLNVFPIPDGDTGTNMTLTITVAAREVAGFDDPTMDQLAKAISSGSLRGARGNSGIVLSQFLRGLTRKIKSVTGVDTTTLANVMMKGTEIAYKVVMKPKEGMTLTVIKGMSDKALEMVSQIDDIREFARVVTECGDYALSQTPEMLLVLKQTGMVDSGGQGLMQVVKGAVGGLLGKTVDLSLNTGPEQKEEPPRVATSRSDIDTADTKFGYHTEFIANLEEEYSDQGETESKAYLESIGSSPVMVSSDEIIEIHVHTSHPGLTFERVLTFSSLPRMKVNNMREEHQERVIKDSERMARKRAAQNLAGTQAGPGERKEYGLITVSSGDGLSEIFKGVGIGYLIKGGQTMNPSTEDMLSATDRVNAENIFIPPNNKNIITVTQQARDLTEDKNVIVIPSKTVSQGIIALANFMPDLSTEESLSNMTEGVPNVKAAQIIYVVRITEIDGMDIEEEDVMATGSQGMLAAGKSVENVAMDVLGVMLDRDSEPVTVYYGYDMPQNVAEGLTHRAAQLYPDKEIELQRGGQPICYYMISAEQTGVCRQERLRGNIRHDAMGSGQEIGSASGTCPISDEGLFE